MARKALLLINLGSPQSPDPADVREYLNEFLTDPYVIDLPTPLRQILVRAFISPKRSITTGEAYEKIWTPRGSPLIDITDRFAAKVADRLGDGWEVRWGMRYGEPSLQEVCENWDVNELLLFPLYPQFAESSTRTALEEAIQYVPGRAKISMVKDFFADEEYIESEVHQIQRHLNRIQPDHLLLSFHGLPEHHMKKLHPKHCFKDHGCCEKVDENNRFCYRAQCISTARAISSRVTLERSKITVGFQSRLGRRPWLQPYTDYVVTALAKSGVKRLAVACPSFVADNLETLEEVQVRLREQFLTEGGRELQLIPSLNTEDFWVNNFCKLVNKKSLNAA